MPDLRDSIAVTVASGAIKSSAIRMYGMKPVGIVFPTDATPSGATMHVAFEVYDGATFSALRTTGRTVVAFSGATGTAWTMGFTDTQASRFVGFSQLKILTTAGATTTGVTQAGAAAKTFRLIVSGF
jgi:hypothetical protein